MLKHVYYVFVDEGSELWPRHECQKKPCQQGRPHRTLADIEAPTAQGTL